MSGNAALIVQAVIALGGVLASVTVSAFISGMRWGAMQQELRQVADRLARIEGMFTLRLREEDGRDPEHR